MTKQVVQRVQVGGGGGPVREGYKVVALLSQAWISLDLWGSTGSYRHTQGLLPATWLYQGITTPLGSFINDYMDLFDELLGLGLPGGVLSLGLPLHHLQRVVRCVELCPQTLNRPDLHFEGAGNRTVVITWIGRGMSCTAVHLRSRSLNIVSLSDMIEGSYRSWDLYTTGPLVDGLQQKTKTCFH